MLGKLLKYDLKYILRYWWLLALASVGATAIGSTSFWYLTSLTDESANPLLVIVSIFALIGAFLVISAFLIATEIFLFIRFYTHFFSDEGYLTFTLPVKRKTLLNSKLLAASLVQICTVTLCVVEFILIFAAGFASSLLNGDIFAFLFEDLIAPLLSEAGGWIVLYIIELILLYCCAIICSTLLIYICITFAAVVIKKMKVFAAIGIYYVVSSAVSFVMQLVYMLGGASASAWITSIPPNTGLGLGALILFIVAAMYAVAAIVLYTFELWLLDRKLNLA